MSENTTSNNGQATQEKRKKVKINGGPFATQQEAEAKKPAEGKVALFKVTDPTGNACWVWSNNHGSAVTVAAKAAGWKVASAGKPVDKVKVGEMLAGLSEDDRKALLAQYQPAKKK